MAVDLSTLVNDFSSPLSDLITRCAARGIEMRPYNAVRTPFEQARLWRQSRAIDEITGKIADLRTNGAGFLAFCLESVGPQHGDPVTNALPGLSWHQWGEAVDCFLVVDGKAEWSTTKNINGLNGYHVYADEAETLGLTSGGHWKSLKDWPHVQLRTAAAPSKTLSLLDIDAEMKRRFG